MSELTKPQPTSEPTSFSDVKTKANSEHQTRAYKRKRPAVKKEKSEFEEKLLL